MTLRNKIGILVLVVFFYTTGAASTSAAVLYSQTDFSVVSTTTVTDVDQQLGSGLSGILTGASFYLQGIGGDRSVTIELKSCDSDTGGNCVNQTGNVSAGTAVQNSLSLVTASFTPYTLDPAKHYILEAQTGVSGIRFYGKLARNGTLCVGTGGTCDSLGSSYYLMFSSPSYTNEGVLSVISPSYASIASVNNQPFSFIFNVNSLNYQYAGYLLTDLTSGQSIDSSGDDVLINASGVATYLRYRDLVNAHQYQWQPYLKPYATSTGYLFGPSTFFFAGSNQSVYIPPAPSNPYATSSGFTALTTLPTATSSNATSTLFTTGIVPDALDRLLRRKFPFSYVYDFRTVLSELATGSGTVEDLTFTFPVGVGSSTNTLTLLHNADVQRLSPVIVIKTIERSIMYVMAGWYILSAVVTTI